MYSQEKKDIAIKAYIANGCKAGKTVRELGYPTIPALIQWYEKYEPPKEVKIKKPRIFYTQEQQDYAVQRYIANDCNAKKTLREIGYGSPSGLRAWVRKQAPDKLHPCTRTKNKLPYTEEQKQQAILDLCSGNYTSQEVADKYDISRCTLYAWKLSYLGKGPTTLKEKTVVDYTKELDELNAEKALAYKEIDKLKEQIYQLQMEKDVLETVAEVLKKHAGSNLENLKNREKAMVIDTLRTKYPLNKLLKIFHMAKSSYCYQSLQMRKEDKFKEVRSKIHTIFEKSRKTYGYRRIHSVLKTEGIRISEKIVRSLMKEEHLCVMFKKRKKYSSYLGEISPAVDNVVNRDFHSDKPNEKWLTDITEFSIPAGKVYLSPIIDCFDGYPVEWTIGEHPNAALVNEMLDKAILTLNEDEHPIVHSDRGCHYRWPGWIERMDEAHLIRSMSKKGCSPDNSACEGFFGRLKNEMFYGWDWKETSIEQFKQKLNQYIEWYRDKRIKMSLGGMSPLEYRRSLGLIN